MYVNVSPFLERGFATLESPDRTGFQGLTTTAIVKCFRDDGCFTAEGYCHPVAHGKYVRQHGDATRSRFALTLPGLAWSGLAWPVAWHRS